MSTRILIGTLVVLFLVVALLPTGLGVPELVALLLISVALLIAWRRRRRSRESDT